eukprot:CAMPEP_0172587542 /NCGR_PEP_ID=MMETSP1068-20121228/6570_1 /TAXON_ID=35684 /ORGANISM="Pseudopedinella elastica, Strain CCMP716" /LENGTH=341 /DNA_ID=CAMNT_0013382597 /DNA_START=181 /DNA_END=1203 /DNA_ORIENTATION=+
MSNKRGPAKKDKPLSAGPERKSWLGCFVTLAALLWVASTITMHSTLDSSLLGQAGGLRGYADEAADLRARDSVLRAQAERIIAQEMEIRALKEKLGQVVVQGALQDDKRRPTAMSSVTATAEAAALHVASKASLTSAASSRTSATPATNVDSLANSASAAAFPFTSAATNAGSGIASAATTPGAGSTAATKATPKAQSKAISSKLHVTTLASGCEVAEGMDYRTSAMGKESVVSGLSVEECCERCLAAGPEKCAVAVYSSARDRPPNACWLKSQVEAAVAKPGVRACAMPGALDELPGLYQGGGGVGGVGGGGDTSARYESWASTPALKALAKLPPKALPE